MKKLFSLSQEYDGIGCVHFVFTWLRYKLFQEGTQLYEIINRTN
jgi:hypothetical protein